MKRILLIILATVLLLCTACSFQAGIGYGLDNGEKISVDFSDEKQQKVYLILSSLVVLI